MLPYPELIQRALRNPDLLKKLTPTEPLDRELLAKCRESADEALTGELPWKDKAALGLAKGGIFYALDALDPAHRKFQDDPGDLASYWHGMVHRREGDFDNARYWFRRAGTLPFFANLHSAASEHSALVARQPNWDPYLFTGQCEQARFGADNTVELVALQRDEFEVVFAYTWARAV